MKIEFFLQSNVCKVIREDGDPYFKSGEWADAESTFLYHVLQALKLQGYDVIKKRMWKDGHMVSMTQQYIRTRSGLSKHTDFAIFNDQYAICDAGLEFNKQGEYTLAVVHGEE